MVFESLVTLLLTITFSHGVIIPGVNNPTHLPKGELIKERFSLVSINHLVALAAGTQRQARKHGGARKGRDQRRRHFEILINTISNE